MAEEEKSEEVKKITVDTAPHLDGADANGDGHISQQELEMHLEYKKKELDDQDAMRDAQRNMAWFALSGMLLYPSLVVLAYLINLDTAGKVLGRRTNCGRSYSSILRSFCEMGSLCCYSLGYLDHLEKRRLNHWGQR